MPPLTRAAAPIGHTRCRRSGVRALVTVAMLVAAGCGGDGPLASGGDGPPAGFPLGDPAATGGNISGTFVLRQVQNAELPWTAITNLGNQLTVSRGTLTIVGEQTWKLQYSYSFVQNLRLIERTETDSGTVTRSGSALAFVSRVYADYRSSGSFSDSAGTIVVRSVDIEHGDPYPMTFVRP